MRALPTDLEGDCVPAGDCVGDGSFDVRKGRPPPLHDLDELVRSLKLPQRAQFAVHAVLGLQGAETVPIRGVEGFDGFAGGGDQFLFCYGMFLSLLMGEG